MDIHSHLVNPKGAHKVWLYCIYALSGGPDPSLQCHGGQTNSGESQPDIKCKHSPFWSERITLGWHPRFKSPCWDIFIKWFSGALLLTWASSFLWDKSKEALTFENQCKGFEHTHVCLLKGVNEFPVRENCVITGLTKMVTLLWITISMGQRSPHHWWINIASCPGCALLGADHKIILYLLQIAI